MSHFHDFSQIHRAVIPVHRFDVQLSLPPVTTAFRALLVTQNFGAREEKRHAWDDPVLDQVGRLKEG